ncbi:MAG: hypothetical protein JXR86_04550 [Spirochaetales bacterium]|nr:hypothetical protein [Spirochaetales bacterium]
MENSQMNAVQEDRTFIQTILKYVMLLLKYKILIITGTSVVAVTVLVFAVISLKLPPEVSPMPNVYEATGVVLFQEGGSEVNMSAMLSAFGIDSSSEGSSPSQLAMHIINSRSFIDEVINKFRMIEKYNIVDNVKNTSRDIFRNSSSNVFYEDSGALVISYNATDPFFASEIVNYEIELLEKWFLEQNISTRSSELSLMEEKLEELSQDIKNVEAEIQTFQLEHGVLDIRDIAEAQSTMLTDLRTSLNQIELQIRSYSEYSTIEDPALTSLKNQRDNVITQIRRIESGYTSSDGRTMPSLAELPQLSLSFSHLTAELELKTQLYQTLSERYEVTKLVASDAGAFTVLEYAEVPEEKIGPMRGQMVVKATGMAFVALIALALLIEYLKKIINDPKNRQILAGKP